METHIFCIFYFNMWYYHHRSRAACTFAGFLNRMPFKQNLRWKFIRNSYEMYRSLERPYIILVRKLCIIFLWSAANHLISFFQTLCRHLKLARNEIDHMFRITIVSITLIKLWSSQVIYKVRFSCVQWNTQDTQPGNVHATSEGPTK